MERAQASEAPQSGRFAFAARRTLQVVAALGCFAPSLSQALESDCADGVCIDVERTENGASFHARNQTAAPVSLLLEFPVFENMTSSQTLPVKAVVLPNERKLLAQIRAHPRAKSIRWQWKWQWTTGVLGAEHTSSTRYWFPWSANLQFEVGQAAGGTFTHHGNWHFAFDFRMPSGTPIRAARDGTVVRAVEDFSEGGLEERFKKRANLIFILHADGTIARYLHLKHGGVNVDVGDRVAAGDLIGFSGNTGYSHDPHLHFDVIRVDENLEWQTVDVRFAAQPHAGFRPESGQILNGGARQYGLAGSGPGPAAINSSDPRLR